jgi:hypothetical protein
MAEKRPKTRAREHWKQQPEEHDFPAASDYLSLLFGDDEVASLVDELRVASTIRRKAKDLLRASGLELRPETDPEVKKDLRKVAGGELLSPVLLVRVGRGLPLIVADGYHRICASYQLDEDADIPCRLAERA